MTDLSKLILQVAKDSGMKTKSVHMLIDAQKKQYNHLPDKEALYRVAKNLGSKAVMRECGNEGNIRILRCKNCDGVTFRVIEILLYVDDLYLGRYTETVCNKCKEHINLKVNR